MLKISTKGRYALRVMIALASQPDSRPVSLRAVAEQQHLTLKYLESIISLLLREQLVVSIRGKAGGYRLSRPAARYTVYEILRATEGALEPVHRLNPEEAHCPLEKYCPTQPVWRGLQRVTREYLESISLADLSQSPPGEFSFCDGI